MTILIGLSTKYKGHKTKEQKRFALLLTWWKMKPKQEQTPWPLVRKRTIPTNRPPLVDEICFQLLWIEGCFVVSAADLPRSLISVF
jgi:hypothetical protein